MAWRRAQDQRVVGEHWPTEGACSQKVSWPRQTAAAGAESLELVMVSNGLHRNACLVTDRTAGE